MIYLFEVKSKFLNDKILIFFLIGCSLCCSNIVVFQRVGIFKILSF